MRGKRVLPILLKVVGIPFSIIIISVTGLLLLALVYCIPTERMENNLTTACMVMEREGTYPKPMYKENSQLDNYTDAIMLMTAANPKGEDNAFTASINCEHYTTGKTPDKDLIYIYSDNGTGYKNTEYARYWHGYLVFLKPLLYFFDYGQIKYIMMAIQLGLFVLLVVMISKRNSRLSVPIFLGALFINPVATMLSLQYNSVCLITLLAMILVVYLTDIWNEKNIYKWSILFLIMGAVTSFIDLLTFPLVSLGFPLLLYVGLSQRSLSLKGLWKDIFKTSLLSVSWLFGYGANLFMKWCWGSLITQRNIFENAFKQLRFRTSSDFEEKKVGFPEVLSRQTDVIFKWVWLAIMVALIVTLVVFLLRNKRVDVKLLVLNAFIGSFPFVWYAFTKNHSYVHSFFTFRELAVLIFAFSSFVVLHIPTKKGIVEYKT